MHLHLSTTIQYCTTYVASQWLELVFGPSQGWKALTQYILIRVVNSTQCNNNDECRNVINLSNLFLDAIASPKSNWSIWNLKERDGNAVKFCSLPQAKLLSSGNSCSHKNQLNSQTTNELHPIPSKWDKENSLLVDELDWDRCHQVMVIGANCLLSACAVHKCTGVSNVPQNQ